LSRKYLNIKKKSIHSVITSVHGKLGLLTFIFLFVQVVFGVTIGMIPITIYGSIDKAKSLWKYHRVLGYTLLLLVWVTAQLGVRADYMYNNLYSTNLIYLHWISFIFVFAGITYRTRISKWGIQSLFN
jgi:cytochrome b561